MLHLQTLSLTFKNIFDITRNIVRVVWYEKIVGLHIVGKTLWKNEASMGAFWFELLYVDYFCYKYLVAIKLLI